MFAQSVSGVPAGSRISSGSVSSFLLSKRLQLGDFQFSVEQCDVLGGSERIQEGGGGLLLLLGEWGRGLDAWWVGGSF